MGTMRPDSASGRPTRLAVHVLLGGIGDRQRCICGFDDGRHLGMDVGTAESDTKKAVRGEVRPGLRDLNSILEAALARRSVADAFSRARSDRPCNEKRDAQNGCRLIPHPRANDSAADRKSTRLNSSHQIISYAVFCLKK